MRGEKNAKTLAQRKSMVTKSYQKYALHSHAHQHRDTHTQRQSDTLTHIQIEAHPRSGRCAEMCAWHNSLITKVVICNWKALWLLLLLFVVVVEVVVVVAAVRCLCASVTLQCNWHVHNSSCKAGIFGPQNYAKRNCKEWERERGRGRVRKKVKICLADSRSMDRVQRQSP